MAQALASSQVQQKRDRNAFNFRFEIDVVVHTAFHLGAIHQLCAVFAASL